MTRPRVQILLLCDFNPFNAQMLKDHIHLLARRTACDVHVLSFRGRLPDALDLTRFHAIVVHYSTFIYENSYLAAVSRARLAAASAVKAVFLHDEYKHVNRTKDALAEIGADVLFTCFEADVAAQVYADPRLPDLALIPVLTGYVGPQLVALSPGPPLSARAVDIGYRGRRYPAWHGRLGRERIVICQRVAADAPRFGLKVDLSVEERDRIYGENWLAFQRGCKAMLGTESGASVIDFTGEIARKVEEAADADPSLSYDSLRTSHFAEIEDALPLATISPRVFEAIACGAALILYPGRYNDRLVPGRHYLALARDHSNFADIAAALADPARLQAMVDAVRQEVLLAPENQEGALLALFDAQIAKAIERKASVVSGQTYAAAAFIAEFGRYDSPLRLPVLKREAFMLVAKAYQMGARLLPRHHERALRGWLRQMWRRLRRV